MAYTFTLCSECGDKYRALSFDSTCRPHLCVMPLNSLAWPDEHPDRFDLFGSCCAPCKESIRRLSYARTYLWRHGELPANHADLWTQAQNLVPDWPGFKRLSLTDDELRSLDACNEELNDVMRTIGATFPKIKMNSQEGGLVQFTATRTKEIKPVLPRSVPNLRIVPATKPLIMRCPNCQEFIAAPTGKCRFCNRVLKPGDIETALARRTQERSLKTHIEVRHLKFSAVLILIAAGILFIPAARPGAEALKFVAAALFLVSSIAIRNR